MNVIVICEIRVQRTEDNCYWIPNTFSAEFWSAYKTSFDRVQVLARTKTCARPTTGWISTHNLGIEIIPVPDFVGPIQLIAKAPSVLHALAKACGKPAAFVLRCPGMLAELSSRLLQLHGKTFMLEVVGDPWDSLGPGAVKSNMRAIARIVSASNLRWMCKHAKVVSYVNNSTLPSRYPASRDAFKTHYSSIVLQPSHLVNSNEVATRKQPPYRLITIGTLDQMYKGIDVLIQALSICVRHSCQVTLEIVGDGRLRSEYEHLTQVLNLGRKVIFRGHLSTADVFKALDESDLFVLPSRQEGLPRALIEAMARGKPVLASSVGGIPDLVSSPYLCPPNDPDYLAEAIMKILDSPLERSEMAKANVKKASEYVFPILIKRRTEAYKYLQACT